MEQVSRSSIEIGVVARPHGVRGAMKVKLHHEGSTVLQRCTSVTFVLAGQERQARCSVLGRVGTLVILGVEGVADRDAAEALRGARVLVSRDALEPLEEGEVLCSDLVGCQVLDEEGRPLGEVEAVFTTGASDVLVVGAGAEERLIPLVEEWVEEVDLEARVIHVRGGDQWEPQPR